MPAKEYNEVKMRGILPSDGMGDIPVKESTPLTSIQVEPKANAGPIPVGKIPDTATQVIADNSAENATVEIYEVSAGKTLYLTCAIVGGKNNAATAQLVYVQVRDGDDNTQYSLFVYGLAVDGGGGSSATFNPPLEIPESWDIIVGTIVAGCVGYATLHGYEM